MSLCWVVGPSLPGRLPQAIRHRPPFMCEPQRRRRRRSTASSGKKMSGGLLEVFDDLMEKQYGRGQVFYGPRTTKKEATEESEDEEWEVLKPNAVLLAGGTGRTGKWVTLGLLNQGFNVRVLTRKFGRGEELFGTSGVNVNVFEGDLTDEQSLVEAVRGANAVIFVAGGGNSLFGGRKSPSATKLARAAVSVGVRRFVIVADNEQAETVKYLKVNSMPYVVVRVRKLNDQEGGLQDVEFTPLVFEGETPPAGGITRLDLAQVVCQALVHDRFITQLGQTDADAGFEFPDVIVHVRNGDSAFAPNARFWRDRFTALSEAFSSTVEIPEISAEEEK